jgi:hypothetical protein
MSIVNNPLTNGLAGADAGLYAPPGGGDAFGADLPPAAGDAIARFPIIGPGSGPFEPVGIGDPDGGASSGSSGLSGFNGVMNGFMNLISNMLASLSSMFGNSASTAGGAAAPGQSSIPQTYFANATASSVGDPHDAFHGTTGQGNSVGQSWDNMSAHGDLLDSNSIAGGYRISTTDTAPQANGVTYNSSATIATDCGATSVTMNANGSYAVTEQGQNVTLTQGRAVPLDGGETVTLNANGSLTVADTNARGGSISTTLASDGSGGVDVRTSATAVDLGGYLVRHADGGGYGYGNGPTREAAPYAFSNPVAPFGTNTAQIAQPNTSVTDVAQMLQQDAEF